MESLIGYYRDDLADTDHLAIARIIKTMCEAAIAYNLANIYWESGLVDTTESLRERIER